MFTRVYGIDVGTSLRVVVEDGFVCYFCGSDISDG